MSIEFKGWKPVSIGFSVVFLSFFSAPPSLSNTSTPVTFAGFECGVYQDSPTTFVKTNERGSIPLIQWKLLDFVASGWTPQARCEEISGRFTRAFLDRKERYVVAGRMNEQNVLCSKATPAQGIEQCTGNNLLVTLRHEGDDPQSAIREINQSIGGSGGSAEDPYQNKAYRLVFGGEEGNYVSLDLGMAVQDVISGSGNFSTGSSLPLCSSSMVGLGEACQ